MIIYKTDEMRVYIGNGEISEYSPLPPNTSTVKPPDGAFVQLQGTEWVVLESYPQRVKDTAPTQFELDQARYSKRAAVKDELIAYMAADNMSRVRNGAWTVEELVSLMTDESVSSATAYMSTLSYELAAQAILTAQTPLLTDGIKSNWVAKLQEHFYL